MTVNEALDIVQKYHNKTILNEDEKFIYVESLQFLIEKTNDAEYMTILGQYYYREKEYDLALKYLEPASRAGNIYASESLGYIWYYGRTGKVDYEKAFHYYSITAKAGNTEAEYKIADMYKNGYFVNQNYNKYCQIIEDLYIQLKDSNQLFESVPEVCMRLGHIRIEQGKTDEALELFYRAKSFFTQRLKYSVFFGTFNNIRWAVNSIYSLIPFDENDFDLFDLYYAFQKPLNVSFIYRNRKYVIDSEENKDGSIAIKFNNKWYRDFNDFVQHALIDDKLIVTIYEDLYGFNID